MSEPPRRDSAISDHGPSPWWPCPACGGIHFRVTCTFERGRWHEADDGELEWRPDDPVSGHPTGIGASDAECVTCGMITNLVEQYGWPVIGEVDSDE